MCPTKHRIQQILKIRKLFVYIRELYVRVARACNSPHKRDYYTPCRRREFQFIPCVKQLLVASAAAVPPPTIRLSLSVTRSHRQQQPLPDGNEMFIRDYVYVKAKYKRSTYRTLRAQKIPHAMQASVCERVVDYEKKFLSMRRS